MIATGRKHLWLPAAAILTAALAAPALAQQVVVELDPARTSVNYTLGSTLHTVHGTFRLKHALIRFDPATGKAEGDLVVDAASGESGSAGRDQRMHRSILESGQYPEIVFTPDHVEGVVAASGTSHLQVHGVFRIHGAGHEMVMPVEVTMNRGEVTAAASFPIPYVKWGMKNPSTLMLRVNDHVDIEIRTAGRAAPPQDETAFTSVR